MELGKITIVKDLRSVWKNEAYDFTRWLAQDENISLLGEELGLDISVIKTEANVGSFNVDILAEDPQTADKIIIEYQYFIGFSMVTLSFTVLLYVERGERDL